MKQSFVLLLLTITVVLSIQCALATDVAYVVKNSLAPQANVLTEIENLGLTYDVIDDSQVSSTDFSNYNIIVLGEGKIENVPVMTQKSLIMNSYYYSNWSKSIGFSTNHLAFNLEHSITEDVTASFHAYTMNYPKLYYLANEKFLNQPVTVKDNSVSGRGKYVIAVKDNPRRVFYGIFDSDYWTTDSQELFSNSLLWLLQGSDNDLDGFFFDDDCNDSNPNVNPNATEIAYNGIDDDCLDGDLVDYDLDGYNSSVVGGSDCDDSNPEINIESNDIYMNCLNDAPIVSEITKIVVSEGEEAVVIVNASDPEDDELIYSINDSRFKQDSEEKNVFRWETGFYDAGSQVFILTVSDSEFDTVTEFEVLIENTNQRPVCDSIGPVEWEEDSTAELNLSDYCYDLDSSDNLTYYYYDSSDNDYVILDSIDNESGIAVFSTTENWNGEDWIRFSVTDSDKIILTNEIILNVTAVNDAPIISSFDAPVVSEGEEAVIIVNVSDPEDDELTYSINDSRFKQDSEEKNVFRWETGFYDAGNYSILVKVNDSEYSSEAVVEVEVATTNQVPECDPIGTVEWEEDSTGELNLSDYCYDLDSDNLEYYIYELGSNKINIDQSVLATSGYFVLGSDEDFNGESWITFRISDGSSEIITNNITLNVTAVNDAPIIEEITKVIVSEGEEAVIIVNASDIEDDELTYSINDSRFVQDDTIKNLFRWETGFYDAGNYSILVKVNDSEYSSEAVADVEVATTNQVPECDSIGTVEWKEDSTGKLNLSEYCHDFDEENSLTYYYYDSSDGDSIILESFDNKTGVVLFSSAENWNGEDWIRFSVSDSEDGVVTNKITLNVTAVNDAPTFDHKIENLTFEEESLLKDEINLYNHFSDVDLDDLEFGFSTNTPVEVTINQTSGGVSFDSPLDYHGVDEIVFWATDGLTDKVYSNIITINVTNTNEAPEFGNFQCEEVLEEEESSECEMNATDFEDNEPIFGIYDEVNAECEIVDGNKLVYSGVKDFNGEAKCIISLTDEYNDDPRTGSRFTTKQVIFNVTGINDAPTITSFSPNGEIPKLIEGENKEFDIRVNDVDNETVDLFWFLDSSEVGNSLNYIFSQNKGAYNLKAVVSDGEYNDSVEWTVVVGDISEFTCSEVNGYVCNNEEELCSLDYLGVNDSDFCCPVMCSKRPPEFNDANTCESEEVPIADGLEIEIKNPDNGDNYEPGEIVGVEVGINNELTEDMKFDIEISLYDLTDDETVTDKKESIDIDSGDSETVEVDFELSEDIKDHDYAIFVNAIDEDKNNCNEQYVEIDIERKENDVVIENIEVQNLEELICNDLVELEMEIKNKGLNDFDDLRIVVLNNELNVIYEGDEFKIDKFDKRRDTVKENVEFYLPNDAKEGNYSFKAIVYYDGDNEEDSELFNLEIGECKKKGVTPTIGSSNSGSNSGGVISLGGGSGQNNPKKILLENNNHSERKSFFYIIKEFFQSLGL